MVNFSDDFFKAEIRNDFYIEEMMKRYWACCINTLQEIDKVCKKYNLKYFGAWGTLLGTVRHHGFIPWDDDMDIMMLREDYEKLLKVLPNELPKKYVVSTCFNNEKHEQPFASVANGSEIVLSEELLQERYGCPFVSYVDIFPLDYIPGKEDEEEMIKNIYIVIWKAIDAIREHSDEEKELLEIVEEYLNVKLDRNNNMIGQLWRLANLLVSSYTEKDGNNVTIWNSYLKRENGMRFNRKWFDKVKYMPFENIIIPVPEEYGKILKKMYGEWEVPKKGIAGHGYPCYKNQQELLNYKLEEMNH